MANSPNLHSRTPGDGRQNAFQSSGFALNDPRNHRIDTIINAQAQQSSSSSGFDTSSPVSLDFNFPFAGSPHGSSNSGIDAPPDIRMGQSQGFPARSSMSDMSRMTGPKMASQQHRASLASIDSAFDRDAMNMGSLNPWTPSNSVNQAVSNSDDSPRKSGNGGDQDKKPSEDDKMPSWSEMKTKAGKERKRLPLACIACRRKKIRCSGEKPACKHCLRARVPCVYKVTTRKAAPRTDYMAMLDKRLKRMEDRVIRVIPKEEQPDLTATGRSSVRPPLPGQPPKKEKPIPGNKRSAEEAFTHEMSDWNHSRQRSNLLDPTTGLKKQREGENRLFIEGSEKLPPQHIQEHLAEVFFDCVYGQSYLLLHKPSFMRKLKAGTVPPVLILAVCAISARFSTHPQVSTEPAFLRGEQWATPAREIVEKRHYEPNITILTAMLMLGLHYFGTCEGGLSWSFGGQAMRMGYALQLHRELDHDPLGRNQIGKSADPNKPNVKPPELSFTDREIRRRTMWACYLMDTFNSSGTERPSFLNEDYYQIQLPTKESHFQMEVSGPTEDLQGNILITPSQKASNNITSDPTDFAGEAKSNMGVAAYIVRAVVIWKRIVKYLNLGGKEKDPHPIWDPLSQFSTLQQQITQLQASLPSNLTYTTDNLATHISERLANQYLFFHIILAQTSLFLHRFAIPTHPSSRPHHHSFLNSGMPKPFLTASANIVIDSAALISSLIADSTGHTLTVPFAGYCAYAAATIHVWGIFSKSPALEASSKDSLRHNYKYLTRMKRYWGMFHYMAESVKDIYRAFADNSLKQSQQSLRQQPSNPKPESGDHSPRSRAATPSHSAANSMSTTASKTMFQYGDWFDKYPHGVSESEWENSHLEYRKEGDKGTEAVMSQRSDLQSVEEFFASLSPPSKAEEGDGITSRGKKVPRRRGKSVAENKKEASAAAQSQKKSGSTSNSTTQIQQQRQGSNTTPTSQSQSQSQSQNQPARTFSASDFDLTSPALYQTPSQPQSQQYPQSLDFASTPTPQFNFNYSAALPNLDRQMVFGAYAGIDPSANESANAALNQLTNPNNNTTTPSNPTLDASGFPNSWDTSAFADSAPYNYSFNDSLAGGNSNNNMMGGSGGTAWFMPFNIEPPTWGMGPMGQMEGMDLDLGVGMGMGGGGEEYGGSALDGMDLSELAVGDGSERGRASGSVNSGGGNVGGGQT